MCGGVSLLARGPPLQLLHCHCSACRRTVGAAFGTWASYALNSTFFANWSELRCFRRAVTDGELAAARWFCGRCGCSIAMSYDGQSGWPEKHTIWLSVALLQSIDACWSEGSALEEPFHSFAAFKAEWVELNGEMVVQRHLLQGDATDCVEPLLRCTGPLGWPSIDLGSAEPVPDVEGYLLRGAAPAPPNLEGLVCICAAPDWAESTTSGEKILQEKMLHGTPSAPAPSLGSAAAKPKAKGKALVRGKSPGLVSSERRAGSPARG